MDRSLKAWQVSCRPNKGSCRSSSPRMRRSSRSPPRSGKFKGGKTHRAQHGKGTRSPLLGKGRSPGRRSPIARGKGHAKGQRARVVPREVVDPREVIEASEEGPQSKRRKRGSECI